jgi:hypothetical protein
MLCGWNGAFRMHQMVCSKQLLLGGVQAEAAALGSVPCLPVVYALRQCKSRPRPGCEWILWQRVEPAVVCMWVALRLLCLHRACMHMPLYYVAAIVPAAAGRQHGVAAMSAVICARLRR